MKLFIFCLFCLSHTLSFGAWNSSQPHIEVALLSSHTRIEAGTPLKLGIHFKPEKDWHIYWLNPGDSGEPLKINYALSQDLKLTPEQWPAPTRIQVGPLFNFGYPGETLFFRHVDTRKFKNEKLAIKANVSWLVCKEECIPGKAELTLEIPAGKAKTSPNTRLFQQAQDRIPIPVNVLGKMVSEGGSVTLIWPQKLSEPNFFPLSEGIFESKQSVQFTEEQTLVKFSLFSPAAPQEASFVITEKFAPPVEAKFILESSPQTQQTSLWLYIFYALAGGMLLNLMPCVFPILFLKAMQLMESEAHHQSKTHAIAYMAGVTLSFLGLGLFIFLLRRSGELVGWGFQLQSPFFVAAMALLFFILALNLSGYFPWNFYLPQWGQKLSGKNSPIGAFATGVLATLIATPCTAPFMGAAMGYTLNQSAGGTVLIFTTLGFGMALPYGALALWPKLGSLFPKPGKWMELVKEFCAFPLLATSAWLVHVYAQLTDSALMLLFGMILLALAVWLLKHFKKKWFLWGFCLLTAFWVAFNEAEIKSENIGPQAQSSIWVPFSEIALQSALAQDQSVFVNFTADWCITCKVNEKLVFSDLGLMQKLKNQDIVFLKADWTHRDDLITEYLQSFKRLGVPLYVFYRPGMKPKVLPQVLTKAHLNSLVDSK